MDHPSSGRPLFGTAVILAGGQSRRMGFDKQTLELDGQPVVGQIAQALSSLFSDIILVTNRPELYEDLLESLPRVRLVSDLYPGRGPMAGIHASLLLAQSRYVYVIGCDMPYLSPPFILFLMQKIRSKENSSGAMLKRDAGFLEPLNAFYSRDLAGGMETALKGPESGLQAFCRDLPFVWVSEEETRPHDPRGHMFQDFNQPQDLPADRPLVYEASGQDGLTRMVCLSRVTGKGAFTIEDPVIREIECKALIDHGPAASFFCLPDRLEDLITGWMYLGSRIRDVDDIQSLQVTADPFLPDQRLIRVELNDSISKEERARRSGMSEVPELTLDQVSSLMGELDQRAELFRRTGGTHNMLLVDLNLEVLDHCEEVSRHNCLIKLAGRAVREGRDLSSEILVSSCRLTASITELIARAGIPLAVSQAAVTSRALDMAGEAGFRLIGFARDKRFNRYL